MNYKLLRSEFKLEPKVLIAYRTFSFTLPSNKKTCIAEGKYIIEEETMVIATMSFKLRVGKKEILSFYWMIDTLQVDTTGDNSVDRCGDFPQAIRKRGKHLDKKDVKMIIDAFENDFQELFKAYIMEKAKKFKDKKVTKNDKVSKKRR